MNDELEPDPTFLGRLFLLLRAVLKHGAATTDDATLKGEDTGRRRGHPKAVGRAAAYAHSKGWVAPLQVGHPAAARCINKSKRKTRAAGAVEIWIETPLTRPAFEALKKQLTTPPKLANPGLFDDLE